MYKKIDRPAIDYCAICNKCLISPRAFAKEKKLMINILVIFIDSF